MSYQFCIVRDGKEIIAYEPDVFSYRVKYITPNGEDKSWDSSMLWLAGGSFYTFLDLFANVLFDPRDNDVGADEESQVVVDGDREYTIPVGTILRFRVEFASIPRDSTWNEDGTRTSVALPITTDNDGLIRPEECRLLRAECERMIAHVDDEAWDLDPPALTPDAKAFWVRWLTDFVRFLHVAEKYDGFICTG